MSAISLVQTAERVQQVELSLRENRELLGQLVGLQNVTNEKLDALTDAIRADTRSKTKTRAALISLLGKKGPGMLAGFAAGAGVAKMETLLSLLWGDL